jgi:protein-tyrosine sulfotransferase
MRFHGLTRQLYVDVVRARSRVRVVPATNERSDEPPIFVVGIYRSGTTLLRYVLDSHPRIACPPETNFLNCVGSVLGDSCALQGLESMGFDRQHVTDRIRNLCDYFYSNYAASCEKPRWADKTPLYIDHLGVVAELFPDAKYVVIHRHPLDQIHSHTKGGTFVHPPLAHVYTEGEEVRVAAARYWVDQTHKIMDFCAAHPPAAVITYEGLCAEPRSTVAGILAAVGEEWSEEVLDFHHNPHDHGKEAASIQRIKGFQLQAGRYRSWAPDVLAACVAVVKDTATTLGYEVERS